MSASRFSKDWVMVASAFILSGSTFGIWASRIPAFVIRFELSPAALGGFLFILAFGAILSFPCSGYLSDRFGAVTISKILAFSCLTVFVCLPLAGNILFFGLFLFLFGMFNGGLDIAMNVWASEVQKRYEKQILSSFHAMFSLGAGIGAILGFSAASKGMSIQANFYLGAFFLIPILGIILMSGWRSEIKQSEAFFSQFAIPKKSLMSVGLIAFCSSLGEGGVADWSALYLVLVTQASQADAALGFAIFSLAMVIFRLMGDKIIALLGKVSTGRASALTAFLGAALVLSSGYYPIILCGLALMGAGYAILIPVCFSRAAEEPSVSPGAAIASVSTLGYSGFLLGPPVLGLVAEYTSMASVFLILMLLTAIIFAASKQLAPSNSK